MSTVVMLTVVLELGGGGQGVHMTQAPILLINVYD